MRSTLRSYGRHNESQCTCGENCRQLGKFDKIIDLKHLGLVVYHYEGDSNKLSLNQFIRSEKINEAFVIHNSGKRDIKLTGTIGELKCKRLSCPRYRHIIDHAQRLLLPLNYVMKHDVLCVCDDCYDKENTCFYCEKAIQKYITENQEKSFKSRERIKKWLRTVKNLLMEETPKEGDLIKAYSELDIDQLVRRSQSKILDRDGSVRKLFDTAGTRDHEAGFHKHYETARTMDREAGFAKPLDFVTILKPRHHDKLLSSKGTLVSFDKTIDFLDDKKIIEGDKDPIGFNRDLPDSDMDSFKTRVFLKDLTELTHKDAPPILKGKSANIEGGPSYYERYYKDVLPTVKSKQQNQEIGPSHERQHNGSEQYHKDTLPTFKGKLPNQKIGQSYQKYDVSEKYLSEGPSLLSGVKEIKTNLDKDFIYYFPKDAKPKLIKQYSSRSIILETRDKLSLAEKDKASHRREEKVKRRKISQEGEDNQTTDEQSKVSTDSNTGSTISGIKLARNKGKKTPLTNIGSSGNDLKGKYSKEKTGLVKDGIDKTGLVKDGKDKTGVGKDVKDKGGPGKDVKDKGGPGKDVKDKGGPGKDVKDKGGPGKDVKDKGGPGKDVKDKGGPGKDVKDKGGPGKDVKDKGGPGKDVKDIGGPGKAVKDIGVSGKDVKDKGGPGKDVKDKGGPEKDVKDKVGSGKDDKNKGSSGKNLDGSSLEVKDFKDAKSLKKDDDAGKKQISNTDIGKKSSNIDKSPAEIPSKGETKKSEKKIDKKPEVSKDKAEEPKDTSMFNAMNIQPNYGATFGEVFSLAPGFKMNKDGERAADRRIKETNIIDFVVFNYDSTSNLKLVQDDSDSHVLEKIKIEKHNEIIIGQHIRKSKFMPRLHTLQPSKPTESLLPAPVATREINIPKKVIKGPEKPKEAIELQSLNYRGKHRKSLRIQISFNQVQKVPLTEEKQPGVIRYALSDHKFIDKGWTVLPIEKVVRKMKVYRMRPAHPEYDWFSRNKENKQMTYEDGQKLADIDKEGRGRWYYKNGRVALNYYDSSGINGEQRFVVYSNGEPDEQGRARPYTVLAMFDYSGNGVVLDHTGKIRLKYNQSEGLVLDQNIGPPSHWHWHTLNEPPQLQQVMIDTHLPQRDSFIANLAPKGNIQAKVRPNDEDMLAIEFDNFMKEKNKEIKKDFRPFQIKMKAMKINEQFSLKVLDQANVILLFRDGKTNLKLNIGMILDHKEIVDVRSEELGEVSVGLGKIPATTESLADLQQEVCLAQDLEKKRRDHEYHLRRPHPLASVDRMTAIMSRPQRVPLRTDTTKAIDQCECVKKRFQRNVYYSTRFL